MVTRIYRWRNEIIRRHVAQAKRIFYALFYLSPNIFIYVQVTIYKVGDFLYSLNLDITLTLILAIILFIIGTFIKNKVSLLEKFCIPSPVVGGLLFCILTLFLRLFNICDITMDTSLMDYLICFFFTTIGIGMSMNLVKKGGKSLIRYWLLCGALSLFQNLIAVFTSKAININPLIGLMCGTISMEGGHGSSAAYGATIESLGIDNAISVGIAASTLGLILAGLIGAPLAKYLIDKYKLKSSSNSSAISISHKDNKISSDILSFLEQLLTILVCISLGKLIAHIVYILTGIINKQLAKKILSRCGKKTAKNLATLIKNYNLKIYKS